MNSYRSQFGKQNTFLAVVHAESRVQVLRNIEIARDGGADGVFLINHNGMSPDELIEYYHAGRERFPETWIGLNMLGTTNREALSIIPETDCSLWSDNAGITDSSENDAKEFLAYRAQATWQGIFFGGVAFKGYPVRDPVGVAKRSVRYVDVVTTSGPRTGVPPDPNVIAAMKAAIGDMPLAIASGVSSENVHLYRDHTDCFLVASSVLKHGSFTEFSPRAVRAFASALEPSAPKNGVLAACGI